MNQDIIEEDVGMSNKPEDRAVEIVKRDFERAEKHLKNFHKQCVDRYHHYVAPGLETNIEKDKSFPTPFATEQIDTLTADMMEKLWYKDQPCSIYGRNKSDSKDSDAKRAFMLYQDDADDSHSKVRQAILNCCICKIAPAVVNFKEEYKIVEEVQERPILNPMSGLPVLLDDGITPALFPEVVKVRKYSYQGATVALIDPIDFFFTQEKREVYDEHPMMIRQKTSADWFKGKPYFLESGIKKLKDRNFQSSSSSDTDDLLTERRSLLGFTKDEDSQPGQYDYVEWHGYFDPNNTGEKELYILGVVDNEILMRMQTGEEAFDLGHPNIVIGNIGQEYGEIIGLSLMDKIHSVVHAMDTMMGMLLKNLRQTAHAMWAGDDLLLKDKRIVADAGTFIRTKGDPNKAFMRLDPVQISQDIYAGLEILRDMGQNASGLNDISSGKVQEGVETLGEADILKNQTAQRTKGGYLRSFEKSFIEPLWKMRNEINMRYVTDEGYLYAVLEDDIMDWRKIEPNQVRADVDFICEASVRENQRAVITQQILQAVNLNLKMIEILGPLPMIRLLDKLYEEGFGWRREDIENLLPVETIAKQLIERDREKQQQIEGENPQNMPQPKSEGDAQQSAQKKNSTPVGRIE